MRHYRGIKIVNAVPLECKDGSPNIKMIDALDKLVKRLEQTGVTLVGAYHATNKPIKARCDKGHDIEIKPNDFVSKKAGCKHCFMLKLHGHDKTVKVFEGIVKRHKLTHEPLDYSKGVLQALKQEMPFYCPRGHEYWSSPFKLVNNVNYICYQCYVMNNKVDKA